MHTRTTPLPPVELADPVWTIEHVARLLRLGPRATRTAITAPGFPAPFRLNPSPTARLYWLREDVLAHLATLAGAPPPAPVPAATHHPAARTTPRRPLDREAALAEIAAGQLR